MPFIGADLVICDWGGNDFMYKNRVEPQLESIMIQTLQRIRKSLPNAVILIPSAQDINKKGKNVTAAKQYAALARKVALENNCLFYDWFVVSGGSRSMYKWSEYGIASKDNVHLNIKGYQLKGNLFVEAFLNSLNAYKNNLNPSSLLLNNGMFYLKDSIINDSLIPNIKDSIDQQTKFKKPKKIVKKIVKKRTFYKVKKGDTIAGIARKNRLTVRQLKAYNNLKGNSLKIGQRLILSK